MLLPSSREIIYIVTLWTLLARLDETSKAPKCRPSSERIKSNSMMTAQNLSFAALSCKRVLALTGNEHLTVPIVGPRVAR